MKSVIAAFIFTYLFMLCAPAEAQFKQIAESPNFDEPVNGFTKIVQMKNGNTVYLNITPKKGIDVRIYDANHAEKVATTVDINIERVKEPHATTFFPTNPREEIDGIFEIAGDIVIFMNEFTHKKSALYRIIIDGNNSNLKEEKEIFNELWATYIVKKDEYSDNYAILTGERIFHYNADHKEMNAAGFKSPDAENSTLHYRDMIVIGKDRICSFYQATNNEKEFKGSIYMITMENVSAKISYDKLDLPPGMRYDQVIAKYDPIDKKIIFLTIANTSTDGYKTYVNIIDPVSKQIEKITGFGVTESLNQAYAERFDKKTGYSGLPQNLFINTDGTISVVYEEFSVLRTSAENYSRTDTKLGKLVVSTFDKKGKIISNYLVPKAHWVIFTSLGLFYHYQQQAAAMEMWRGNQYKPFQYIDGPKGRFIFFNDTERNNEVNKDKFAEVQAVADCDAFMYRLAGSDVFPKREYAFEPVKKDHQMAMFSVSEYDNKTNVYVTLKHNASSRKKVKLVWLQPE